MRTVGVYELVLFIARGWFHNLLVCGSLEYLGLIGDTPLIVVCGGIMFAGL